MAAVFAKAPVMALAAAGIAVLNAFTLHEYEISGRMMILAASLALRLVALEPAQATPWAKIALGLGGSILLLNGITDLSQTRAARFRPWNCPQRPCNSFS